VWEYKGIDDPTQLWVGLPVILDPTVLKAMVSELCGGAGNLECLPPSVVPLFLDHEDIDEIMASMPECNEWRILPSWVSPVQYSGNVPLAPKGERASSDDEVVEVPREPVGSRHCKQISTLAELECRREPAQLTGGSSSYPVHHSLYDDDDDDDKEDPLSLSHRRRMPVRQTPLGTSATTGPATGASSASRSSQAVPASRSFLD
jgi:hypothetical protein